MSEKPMTPERRVIFDAIVARVLAIGMEKDVARAVERATVMVNNWSWVSDNSDDGTGRLTIYDGGSRALSLARRGRAASLRRDEYRG
jgi:hypothetical protein